MGMFSHGPEIIAILVVALLVFGPKKLPEMGASIGKSIKEFKSGMSELTSHKEEPHTPPSANLDAIEREIASKKAAAQANEAARAESVTEKPFVPESNSGMPEMKEFTKESFEASQKNAVGAESSTEKTIG